VTDPDLDDPGLAPRTRRLAGGLLALAALLVLGYAVAFVVEDVRGSLVLLLLFAVVTLPVLGAGLLSAEPALALLRGQPGPPRTPVLAGLLAVGGAGIAFVALRPGLDDALSAGDLAAGAAGGVAALAALVVLALVLPGRATPARVMAAVSGGMLVLSLVALRALG